MRIEQLLGKEAEIILPMLTELRKSGIEKVEQILKKIKEGEDSESSLFLIHQGVDILQKVTMLELVIDHIKDESKKEDCENCGQRDNCEDIRRAFHSDIAKTHGLPLSMFIRMTQKKDQN